MNSSRELCHGTRSSPGYSLWLQLERASWGDHRKLVLPPNNDCLRFLHIADLQKEGTRSVDGDVVQTDGQQSAGHARHTGRDSR